MFTVCFSLCKIALAESIVAISQEKGVEHKRKGDILYEMGDMKGGSREYIRAFESGTDFTEEELLLMAKRVSWAGDLADAERMLKKILSKNPGNREAKLHLARVLSWQGRIYSALDLVEEMLKDAPDDREMLFIKADALRYMGRPDKALKIYERLLTEREDFDIRLAQNYALIQLGLPSKVHEASKKLNPTLPYQVREYNQLKRIIRETLSPTIRARYSYFQDSDDNEVQRATLKMEGHFGDIKGNLILSYIEASDNAHVTEAQELSINMLKRLLPQSLLDLGIGIAKGGRGDLFLTGRIGLNLYALRGLMGLNFSRYLLSDTRELIDNQIRVNLYNFNFEQRLSDRWIVYGDLGYRSYSDSNQAISFNTHFKYKLNFSYPQFFVGYRIVYLDFDKHKYHGYFDPKDYFSHQVTFTFLYEKEAISIYIEPFVGYQEYKRYNQIKNDWIYGGVLSIYRRIIPGLNLEINFEGGNYAAGTATGWKYYQGSIGIRYNF